MFDCSQHFILSFSCCSLRKSWIDLWRIRPWNLGFSLCSLLSLVGYKGSSLLICFLIPQIYPHNWKVRAIDRSAKWFCGSPGAIPGVLAFPWQEGDQSLFIQLVEDWNLCLALPGWLFWSSAFSNTFSIKTRNEAVLCTQQNGNNLGAEVCFRRCISGSLRYNARKAINLNLFQTRT